MPTAGLDDCVTGQPQLVELKNGFETAGLVERIQIVRRSIRIPGGRVCIALAREPSHAIAGQE